MANLFRKKYLSISLVESNFVESVLIEHIED